jgi:LDH2 family malate/lactate/ureidoglycolate dehydrogenase
MMPAPVRRTVEAPCKPYVRSSVFPSRMSTYGRGDYRTEKIPLKVIPVEPLRIVVMECLERAGFPQESAATITEALMTSELRNLQGQGQGVRAVKQHIERIRKGVVDPHAPFEIVKESQSVAFVDGNRGDGVVISAKAMQLAVTKAKGNGVGTVLVGHSSHFGSASFSASRALPHGCIGVCMTDSGPEMAPWGGYDALLGTSPWAVAIPTGDGPEEMPVILDIALTMSGKGMIGWLLRDGKRIPKSWAITRDGLETDDPASALEGTVLPMGDYKGYGMSFVTEVLTGILSGSAYGTKRPAPGVPDTAHQFIAYDIDWFVDRKEFYERVRDLIRMAKASRLRADFEEVYIPGELEWRRMQEKRRSGVRLDPDIFSELKGIASELKVAWPFG